MEKEKFLQYFSVYNYKDTAISNNFEWIKF